MEENKLINFLSHHWSKLLLGILAIACIAAWTERFVRANDNQSKQDFLLAHQIYEQFQKGETLPAESIEITENILDRHPELHSKYDAMLALTFFSQSKTSEGIHYAQSIIDRVNGQLPEVYRDYAHTSLLISEKKYSEAFEAALSLNGQISEREEYQALDGMNTLRLVFLADSLDRDADKQAFWGKLEKHPHYASIQAVFHEGNLSLADFVKTRV